MPARPIWKWGAGFNSLWSLSCSNSLTDNPWSVDTNPEHGLIPLSHLYNIDRARYAIASIARLVGNSASEPDATGAQPLDAWTVAALMGGVEGLCDHMGAMADAMLESVRACAQDADCTDPTHDAPASIQ